MRAATDGVPLDSSLAGACAQPQQQLQPRAQRPPQPLPQPLHQQVGWQATPYAPVKEAMTLDTPREERSAS